ncbi:MAG: hypothetical protein WKF57_06630 [Nakamurella sp.]
MDPTVREIFKDSPAPGVTYALVTGWDPSTGTATYDKVELLKGEEAQKKWVEDGNDPDDFLGHFYVRHGNPQLRTARVEPNTPITTRTGTQPTSSRPTAGRRIPVCSTAWSSRVTKSRPR